MADASFTDDMSEPNDRRSKALQDVMPIGRFPGIRSDLLSPEQTASLQKLAQARGAIPAPHRFLIMSPMVVDHIAGLGTSIRQHSKMTLREIEIVVLVTAATFGVEFVKEAHKRIGGEAGLSAAAMDGIVAFKPAQGLSERENDIYQLALALQKNGPVTVELAQAMTTRLGETMIAEVIGLIGVYAVTCYALRFVGATQDEVAI